MSFDWSFVLSDRVTAAVAQGLGGTLTVVGWAGLFAAIIGGAVALLRVSTNRCARRVGRAYVAFFRNIPLLILLFFLYFGLPTLLPRARFPFIYANRYEMIVAVVA